MLVDSHCHLDFPNFEGDRGDMLARARAEGIRTFLSIGTQITGWPKVLDIARQEPDVFATIGLHPTDVTPDLLPGLSHLLVTTAQANPRVIGFGETGLDFYHTPFDQDAQVEAFEAHIEASRQADLPLIIHTREAEETTTTLLTQAMQKSDSKGPLRGVIHCFTGTASFAQKMLDLGFYISFSGIVTFKNATALQEIACNVPLDRLLVETDAPYLTPHPLRSIKRNEPAFMIHTAAKIAALRGLAMADIAHHTTENFFTLFSKAQRP